MFAASLKDQSIDWSRKCRIAAHFPIVARKTRSSILQVRSTP
jgi:hypothetical protein